MSTSCYSNALISIDQALDNIKQALTPITATETLSLKTALGRILAVDCIAPFALPPFDNSAMDGYAFNSKDIQGKAFDLQLIGTSWAGRPFTETLSTGQCVRIFTGAVIPEGADSVIMQEQVALDAQTIRFPAETQAQQYIRYTGEDVQENDGLLTAPKPLTAVDFGLLASAGLYEIKVKRKVRIAFFSTGDELRPVGKPLAKGQIYDSNRYLLSALLSDPCYEVNDLGVLADDKALIQQCLVDAAHHHDVIISTGGASVGDADYIQEILAAIGEVNFWKLAIKPGKPLAFGKIQDCFFFGLPGNPISVLATYQQIVTPALRQLSGLHHQPPIRFKALCKSPLYKQAGRQEFQRGILSQTGTGEFEVISAGRQGSNILSASSRANCYIVLAREQTNIKSDTEVLVEPFNLFL